MGCLYEKGGYVFTNIPNINLGPLCSKNNPCPALKLVQDWLGLDRHPEQLAFEYTTAAAKYRKRFCVQIADAVLLALFARRDLSHSAPAPLI